MAPHRTFRVGDRVLCKGPKGDYAPLPDGRSRRKRNVYAGVVTALPDTANGRDGYKILFDGGVRPEGRYPASSLKHAPNEWAGRSMASPLGDDARRVRQRLNPDAEPDSDDEEDEFFDANAEHQDLDDDERVQGPGQRLLDDQADIRDLVGTTVTIAHKDFGDVTWTVVAAETSLAENAASRELLPPRPERDRAEILPRLHTNQEGFELAVFEEMLWMSPSTMVSVINSEHARMRALPTWHRDRIPSVPHWQELSPKAFGKFLGLLVASGAIGRGGAPCWHDAAASKFPSFNPPHFEHHMAKHRFDQIKRVVPWVMASRAAHAADDGWYRARAAVNMFNERRRKVLGVCRHVIADELMSAFVSNHPTAHLPNITYEPRKPEPLGTMFKCLLDNDTKVMAALEICEGARRNRELAEGIHPYGTTACTARLLRETAPETGVLKRVVCGDSWFASVQTAKEVMKGLGVPTRNSGDGISSTHAPAHRGSHFIGVVKTYHGQFPKAFIEEKLRGKSAGARIVLEATVDGVPLIAVGWKYKKSSTLCYVATKGAASTADDPGNPYQMAIKDVEGDRIVRSVPRPEIVGKYYEMNGGIDVHNKMRQGDLALEKHWVTQDPYFRIFTTLIGICVTDAFNMMKYRIGDHRSDPRRHWSLREFAGVLAHQLLNNKWEDLQNASQRHPNSSEEDALLQTQEDAEDLDAARFLQHRLIRVPGTRPNGAGKQLRCHVCGACTSWCCGAPGCVGRKGGAHCGVCPVVSKRNCFDVHRGIIRETPAHTEAPRPLGRLGMSASSGGSVRALSFSAGSV